VFLNDKIDNEFKGGGLRQQIVSVSREKKSRKKSNGSTSRGKKKEGKSTRGITMNLIREDREEIKALINSGRRGQTEGWKSGAQEERGGH